jgi:hypothetical protein
LSEPTDFKRQPEENDVIYRAIGNGFPCCRALAASIVRSARRAGARPAGRAIAGLSAAMAVMVALCSSASADIGAIKCGAPIGSTVKQGVDVQQGISSVNTYVNVTGAAIKVNVPTGQTRCVRVRFSAIVLCDPPTAIDRCYVKVTENLSPLLWDPAIAIAANEAGGAHSYEWAVRLSEGSHVIRMQATKNAGVTFIIVHWTMAVDVAK